MQFKSQNTSFCHQKHRRQRPETKKRSNGIDKRLQIADGLTQEFGDLVVACRRAQGPGDVLVIDERIEELDELGSIWRRDNVENLRPNERNILT